MLALALLLAAVTAQDRRTLPAPDIDSVVTLIPKPTCDRSADEITVCGSADPSRFRLPALAKRYEEPPVRSEFRLPGGARGSVHAISRSVGGFTSPGAAVTLTIPFGKKKRADK